MTALLPILLLLLGPEPSVMRQRVDIIETNHVYSDDGHRVLSQRIHWQWSKRDCRFQVVAWRVIRDYAPVVKQGNSLLWNDAGTLRKVTADEMRETWTQYDPELIEREVLPTEQRLELDKWPKREGR